MSFGVRDLSIPDSTVPHRPFEREEVTKLVPDEMVSPGSVPRHGSCWRRVFRPPFDLTFRPVDVGFPLLFYVWCLPLWVRRVSVFSEEVSLDFFVRVRVSIGSSGDVILTNDEEVESRVTSTRPQDEVTFEDGSPFQAPIEKRHFGRTVTFR